MDYRELSPVFNWKAFCAGCVVLFLVMIGLGTSPARAQDPALPLWDLYKQGQFEDVVFQGKALLNTGTESGAILLAVGRSLTDLNKQDEAQFFLQRAIVADYQKSWIYAWAQVYLGKCQYHLQDIESAAKSWVLARDCRATRNATQEANRYLANLGLSDRYVSWEKHETEHFVFHFSPGLVGADKELFSQQHEDMYDYQTIWFGGGPDRKTRYFIWKDAEEASQAGMPALGFSLPEYFVSHVRFEQTVGHEMNHIISHHAIKPATKTGLINEGSAKFFDGTGRNWMEVAKGARAAQAKNRGTGEAVPLSVMALWLDWGSQTIDVSYPVAGAFVEMMVKNGGQERFLEAFKDQSPENFGQVYGEEFAQWVSDFDAHLNQ